MWIDPACSEVKRVHQKDHLSIPPSMSASLWLWFPINSSFPIAPLLPYWFTDIVQLVSKLISLYCTNVRSWNSLLNNSVGFGHCIRCNPDISLLTTQQRRIQEMILMSIYTKPIPLAGPTCCTLWIVCVLLYIDKRIVTEGDLIVILIPAL